MADDPKPATELQATFNYWLHAMALVLGLIATAVGILASFGSRNANSQADIANAKSNATTQRLNDLQFRLQAATNFAAGVHEARDALAEKNRGIPAMVEVSRLYAVAQTPQQKLVLIQIAQLAKQQAAMLALSTLIANDPDLQPPYTAENRGTVAAINRIVHDATTQIAASLTPPPATNAKRAAHMPTAPPDDPPLTASANHLIAASAALAASLPKTQTERGWIFVGDTDGWGTRSEAPGAQLIPGTAATSAASVPAQGASVTACSDLNLRIVPFQDGALGSVVGIAPAGSNLSVEKPPLPYPKRIDAYRAVGHRSHRPITARWAYIAVAPAVAKPAVGDADVAPTASPARNQASHPTSKPVNMAACTAASGTQALL
jgi:hypothetical protein